MSPVPGNADSAGPRPAPVRALWAAVAAGLLGLLVVLPLAGAGWLLLLDWVPGPHMSLPRSLWGLDGGLVTSLPLSLTTLGLARVLTPPIAAGWLPLALAVAGAGLCMAHLVHGPLSRRLAAGLLYAVNPIVYERAWAGQIGFLLGYALLPLAVRDMRRATDEAGPRRLRAALWIAVLTGISPHFAFLCGVVLAALVLQMCLGRRALGWATSVVAVAALASAYLALAPSGAGPNVRVGIDDLAAFRTTGDARIGLFGNVAALYGFWRQEPPLPRDDVPGWLVFLAALVLVMGVGAVAAHRRPEHRGLLATVGLAGVAGYFLALGDQGPTGGAYRWLFVHLPGFAVMREPQKFVALLALAYAVLFGFGAEDLVRRTGGRRGRIGAMAMVLVLPLAYTPTLFWGLAGRLRPVRYPASWYEADRQMGAGPGRVLFLPWHQYLSFPFLGRIVANPADAFFRREAVAGDNVELAGIPTASRSTRSAYLEFLYAHGTELCSFGRLTAPLGLEYVVLARTVDWEAYRWLDRQGDLERVLDRPELVVYRNLAFRGLGWRAGGTERVRDWGELVTRANAGTLGEPAVTAARQGPGPITPAAAPCPPPTGSPIPAARPGAPAAVRRRSPVTYEVAPGPPGSVVLSEPFDASWALDGRPARELAGGVTGFSVGPRASKIRFRHWDQVRLGYAISLVTTAVLLVVSLGPAGGKRRRRLDARGRRRQDAGASASAAAPGAGELAVIDQSQSQNRGASP